MIRNHIKLLNDAHTLILVRTTTEYATVDFGWDQGGRLLIMSNAPIGPCSIFTETITRIRVRSVSYTGWNLRGTRHTNFLIGCSVPGAKTSLNTKLRALMPRSHHPFFSSIAIASFFVRNNSHSFETQPNCYNNKSAKSEDLSTPSRNYFSLISKTT